MPRPVYNQCLCTFDEKFHTVLKPVLFAFKAARLSSPSKVCKIKQSGSDQESLSTFSFLPAAIIDGQKSELPNYLAASEDVSNQTDALNWWKSYEAELPNWAKACQVVLLVQLSSVAAERIFSLLTNSFCTQQNSSLKITYSSLLCRVHPSKITYSSVMLQYNNYWYCFCHVTTCIVLTLQMILSRV